MANFKMMPMKEGSPNNKVLLIDKKNQNESVKKSSDKSTRKDTSSTRNLGTASSSGNHVSHLNKGPSEANKSKTEKLISQIRSNPTPSGIGNGMKVSPSQKTLHGVKPLAIGGLNKHSPPSKNHKSTENLSQPLSKEPLSKEDVAATLARDYLRCRPRLPTYLAELTGMSTRFVEREAGTSATPKRQQRHL